MTAWPSWVTRQRRERGILGDEAAYVEAFHETRDLGAAPGIGGRGRAEQLGAHVPVAKAVERVFAAEDAGEDGEVGRGRGVEGTGRAAVGIPHRLREAIEGPVGGGRIVDDSQGIEVAVIGRGGHGGIARQECKPFGNDNGL